MIDPYYQSFLRALQGYAAPTFTQSTSAPIFSKVAEAILLYGPLKDWMYSENKASLVLQVPDCLNNPMFMNSLLSAITESRIASSLACSVASATIDPVSKDIRDFVPHLASLIHQILRKRPDSWLRLASLYGAKGLIEATFGEKSHLLEPTLWRCFKALLTEANRDPVVCILHVSNGFGDRVDLLSFLDRTLAVFESVDTDCKLLLAVTTAAPSLEERAAAFSRISLQDAHIAQSLEDDMTKMVDHIIEARPMLFSAKKPLLAIFKQMSTDVPLQIALATSIESSYFSVQSQISRVIQSLSAPGDFFRMMLDSVPIPNRSQVRNALLLMSTCMRPLILDELTSAILTPEVYSTSDNFEHLALFNTQWEIPECLIPFIYRSDQLVHLSHSELKSIVSEQSATIEDPSPWYNLREDPHLQLADLCFRFITTVAKSRHYDQAEKSKSQSHNRNTLFDIPFLEYAVRYWSIHYIEGANMNGDPQRNTGSNFIRDDSVLDMWLRFSYELLPSSSGKHFEEFPNLSQQLSPNRLASRADLSMPEALKVICKALSVLEIVPDNEDISLVWSLGRVIGVQPARKFWFERMDESLRDLDLLCRFLGKDPEFTFQLLNSIEPDYFMNHIDQLLVEDVWVGGSTVLQYLDTHADLSINSTLFVPPLESCASLGFSKAIPRILDSKKVAMWLDLEHQGGSCLRVAVSSGCSIAVRALLSQEYRGVSDSPISDGAVSLASRYGFTEILNDLLMAGLSPNSRDRDGEYPLAIACLNDRLETAQILVSHGAFPGLENEEGYSPLSLAVLQSNVRLVRLFVRALKSQRVDDHTSATHPGIAKSGLESSDISVYLDRNVPFQNYGALRLAIKNRSSEVSTILIKNGAVLDSLDDYGNSLLHEAAESGLDQVLELLLNHKVTGVNTEGLKQETPLHKASVTGNYECVVKLLDHGAKLMDHLDTLERATAQNYIKIVRALLSKPQTSEALGESLQAPAMHGHTQLVVLLLDQGTNIDYMDRQGTTALHLAVYFFQHRVLEILLIRRAQLELKDNEGRTSLADAARRGNTSGLKMLFDAGADDETRDDHNKTPLELALDQGQEEAIVMLLARANPEREVSLLIKLMLHPRRAVFKAILDKTEEGLPPSWCMASLFSASLEHDSDDVDPLTQCDNVVTMLLDHGTDPDDPSVDRYHGSPLNLVSHFCRYTKAKALLEHPKARASVNKMCGFYGTALQACVSGPVDGEAEVRKMLDLLLRHRADPQIQGGAYCSVLHAALLNSLPDVVDDILNRTTLTVDTVDREGRFPAHCAAAGHLVSHFSTIILPHLSASDKQRRLPVHFAAGTGSLSILRRMIEHRPSLLDEKDGDGWTALHWACRQMDIRIIEIILAAKGQTEMIRYKDQKTDEGWLPHHIAILHGNKRFMKVLQQGDEQDEESAISDLTLPTEAWSTSFSSCLSCHCVSAPSSECDWELMGQATGLTET